MLRSGAALHDGADDDVGGLAEEVETQAFGTVERDVNNARARAVGEGSATANEAEPLRTRCVAQSVAHCAVKHRGG